MRAGCRWWADLGGHSIFHFSFATEIPDIEMSPNVSFDDSVEVVLEDLDDEPIVKARVSDS